jgi:hypothetical protein
VFAADLLNALHFWTSQDSQQDAIKIRPNVTHTSFSSSRRRKRSFC